MFYASFSRCSSFEKSLWHFIYLTLKILRWPPCARRYDSFAWRTCSHDWDTSGVHHGLAEWGLCEICLSVGRTRNGICLSICSVRRLTSFWYSSFTVTCACCSCSKFLTRALAWLTTSSVIMESGAIECRSYFLVLLVCGVTHAAWLTLLLGVTVWFRVTFQVSSEWSGIPFPGSKRPRQPLSSNKVAARFTESSVYDDSWQCGTKQ